MEINIDDTDKFKVLKKGSICGCTLYRKYMTKINDVTTITPDLLLNVGIGFIKGV